MKMLFFLRHLTTVRLSNKQLIGQFVRRLSSSETDELIKTRNIGIIAHVDAGKTTTTERMLFYSGLTDTIGDVDKGNTVTDYMLQERERGITITSSPVQFEWNKHVINLIDTPGHIDFNYEVERSLTVLDGSVVILDASAGVESQTYQVWKQSNKFKIPKIVYLNKMDKPRSDYKMCLNDISNLKINHLLLQLPLFDETKKFRGVIDLIRLEKNIWNLKEDPEGIQVECKKLTRNDKEYELAIEHQENLVAKLCEYDHDFSEKVFETDDLNELGDELIVNSIRRSTLVNRIVPVLLGSSFKNIGIQLLMNAVTRYLPCPLERNSSISELANKRSCCFLFKIKYDKKLGALYFVRVYEGQIKQGSKILNYSKNKEVRIEKLFKVLANEYTQTESAKKGDIVAISGLENSSNGDLFVANRETADRINDYLQKTSELSKSEEIILKGFKFPEPVIFCSVEASSPSKELELENALKRLQQEDPSFSIAFNKQTNQTILRGMGNLHLQIIKDRIKRDFKLDPYFGSLEIAYLESFQSDIDHELQYTKVIREIKNNVYIKLKLKPIITNLKSVNNEIVNHKGKLLKVIVSDQNELYRLKQSHSNCIERGIQLALETGPLLSNKVVNMTAELHDFKTTSKTLDTVIVSAAYECVKEAFNKDLSNFHLLEPIMRMEIDFQEKNYSEILSELTSRRSIIVDHQTLDDHQTLQVFIPFAETIDLSAKLRSITSGHVHYTMQIDNYLPVNKSDETKIIEKAKFGSTLN